MAATSPTTTGAKRDWRNREARPNGKKKYVARRVSEDEHRMITKYVEAIGSTVSDQLAPRVDELLASARAYEAMLKEQQDSLIRAS